MYGRPVEGAEPHTAAESRDLGFEEQRPVSDQDEKPRDERTRLCQSCRMEISALAVKCRFCGETVERPRQETRKLTIEDLGGERIRDYSPSSDVLNALESFREEMAAPPSPQNARGDGLPPLDEHSKAMASAVSYYAAAAPAVEQRAPGDALKRKLAYVGAFVAALLVLYLGGLQVGAMIREYREEQPPQDTFQSEAPELMEQGAPPVEILEAAAEAVRHESTPAHRAQLEQARALVNEEVQRLLDSETWDRSHLQQAGALANRAYTVDSGDPMRRLRDMVNEERWAYNMLIRDIDESSGEAEARLSLLHPYEDDREVTARAGDMIGDRFRITSINARGNHVRMADTKRDDRSLTLDLTGNIR